MIRFFWLPAILACDPAKGITEEITEDTPSGLTTEPNSPSTEPEAQPTQEPEAQPESTPSTEPTSEPTSSPASEPTSEPTSDPTSEPAQEEPDPPDTFSEFVEEQLALQRGSSGLDGIDAQLTLWLDASSMATLTQDGSGNISQWDNRSDNPNHATQADGNARPGYDAVEQMLDFNGSQYLFVEDQSVDVDSTYFVVYKGSDPVGTLFAKSNETGQWTQGGKTFFIRNGRYTTDVGWVGYYHANSQVSTTLASIGTFEHRNDGNNDEHRIYYNGKLELDNSWNYTAHPESSLSNGGVFKIGYTSTDFPQSHGLYGKIGELIKIDQELTHTQRALIHAYLASKWDLTSEVDSDGDGTPDATDSNPFDPGNN